MAQRKALALDTNLLLDLAAGEDFAHDFREAFIARGYALIASPRVLTELANLVVMETGPKQERAMYAARQLIAWQIQSADLSHTNKQIAWRFSQRLLRIGLLPAGEVGDGVILGESALLGLPLVVTNDKHLLGID